MAKILATAQAIEYPIPCDTDEKQFAFCLRVQEKLRLEHNQEGAKCKAARSSYLQTVFNKYAETTLPEHVADRMQFYEAAGGYQIYHLPSSTMTVIGSDPKGLVKIIPVKLNGIKGDYKKDITKVEIETIRSAESIYFQTLRTFDHYKRGEFNPTRAKITGEIAAKSEVLGYNVFDTHDDPQIEVIRQKKADYKDSTIWDPDIDLEALKEKKAIAELIDPYEDFYNDYSEVDPNSHIERASGTPYKVSFNTLYRNETAYVYKDHGAGHFSGDFEHLWEFEITIANNSAVVIGWGMANTLNDYRSIDLASGDELAVQLNKSAGGSYLVYLFELIAGTQYYDSSVALSAATTYYCTTTRDEAVGTYGTLYLDVYSDASRETLVDALSVTLHEKEDFQYYYPCQSYNDSTAVYMTGVSQNHDLQEAAAAQPFGCIV